MKKKRIILFVVIFIVLISVLFLIFKKEDVSDIKTDIAEQEPIIDEKGHNLNEGFYLETDAGELWFEENKTEYESISFNEEQSEENIENQEKNSIFDVFKKEKQIENKEKQEKTTDENEEKDIRQINIEKHEKETGSVGFHVSEPSNSVYLVYIDTELYPGLNKYSEVKVERRTKNSIGWSNWRSEGQTSISNGLLYDWVSFPTNETHFQLKLTEVIKDEEEAKKREPYIIYSKIIECIHNRGEEFDPGYYSELRDDPESIPDNSPVPKKIETFEIVENNEE